MFVTSLLTGELDDDDDDIDDEGDLYMERLRRMGKKMDGDGTVGMNGGATVGGDDSDGDDDELDEAEETALENYETPLDKLNCPVDEYQIFKTLLESESRDRSSREWMRGRAEVM